MTRYNPNIHRGGTIRLKGYDYSKPGLYFITLCTQDRAHLFGEIENRKMRLNEAGKIADRCWREIPSHFPNAVLHEYVIMPNHVHGIIELRRDPNNGPADGYPAVVGIENFQQQPRRNDPFNQKPLKPQRHEFQKMIPRSIASIVKGYKIGVTKWFRNNMNESAVDEPFRVWQRNYYEHIIRDRQSFFLISKYIENNPDNWREDKERYEREQRAENPPYFPHNSANDLNKRA